MLSNTQNTLPVAKRIGVNDPEMTMDVVCFDFPPQLLALLQDKNKMQKENLVIDIDNVTRKHQNPSGLLQESLDGFAYQKAYDNAKANHHGNILCCLFPFVHGVMLHTLINKVNLNLNLGVFHH